MDFNRLNVHLVGFSLKKKEDTLGGHVVKFIFKITSCIKSLIRCNEKCLDQFVPIRIQILLICLEYDGLNMFPSVTHHDASLRIAQFVRAFIANSCYANAYCIEVRYVVPTLSVEP